MSDAATDLPAAGGPNLFRFDNTFVRELEGLYEPWRAEPVPAPALLVLDDELAVELGADPEALRSPDGVAVLAGNAMPAGAEPVAQAYSGHQFGGFSPRLGDGRALLLGEVVGPDGRRRDLQLKGSGRTPFARGGDGKAAVGPMLREYVMGRAMHALGVPTTRMLAVVTTGEKVRREIPLPGAVLSRVAASHLRVGTFQYAAMHPDRTLLRRLADHAIARHHPRAAEAELPALALLEEVCEVQADLVAHWMLIGFIHGVLNTDNVTISGETIDYGPCAFMDLFDPATVFSSIDHGGRYAYGNQPQITQWNLARLAEPLLPLFADDQEAAVEMAMEVLHTFPDRFGRHWRLGMAAKLGYVHIADGADPDELGDPEVIDDVPGLLHRGRVDLTSFFRSLSSAVLGDDAPVRALFLEPEPLEAWLARWRAQLPLDRIGAETIAERMNNVNPRYVPRNHLVEEVLAAGVEGDLDPLHRLLEVLDRPFDERAGLERYAGPAPASFGAYQTFCGT